MKLRVWSLFLPMLFIFDSSAALAVVDAQIIVGDSKITSKESESDVNDEPDTSSGGSIEEARDITVAAHVDPLPMVPLVFIENIGSDLFDVVLSGNDVANAKPSPEIYLKCLQEMNIDPNEAIVVEDSISGVRASGSAGVETIGILGTTGREQLVEAGAAKVINNLNDLVGMYG